MTISNICVILLSIAYHIECTHSSDYMLNSVAGGWLKLNKVVATWQQAFQQCHNEGAVLASPLTEELRKAMLVTIHNNNYIFSYHIGANSKFTPGQYVSVEGVPLANMLVDDLYQLLDTEQGECLSMNGYNITAVDCSKRLPYMCFKKDEGKKLTQCGTFDTEYSLDARTGSCYKVHRELRTWYEANTLCVAEGAYLAIIDDDVEAAIVTNMIPDMALPWYDGTDRSWQPMYIGLLDWNGNGSWLSNHADDLNHLFCSWDIGQPSATNDQQCGAINRRGMLDNIWCLTHASFFICEKDPRYIRYSSRKVAIVGSQDTKIHIN